MATAGTPNVGEHEPKQREPYDPNMYTVNDSEGLELDTTVNRPLPYNPNFLSSAFRINLANSSSYPSSSPDELTINCPPDSETCILYASQQAVRPTPYSDAQWEDAIDYAIARRRAGEMDRKYELLWKLMKHKAIESCEHVEFHPTTEKTLVVLACMQRGESLSDELCRMRSLPRGQVASMTTTLSLASRLALCVVSACHYLHAHNMLVSPLAVLPQFVLAVRDGNFQLRNGLRTLADGPVAKTIINWAATTAAFEPGSGDNNVSSAADRACVAYMLAPAVRYHSKEWTALRRFAGLLKMAVLRMVIKLLHVVVCQEETDATAYVPSAEKTLDWLHEVLKKLGLGREQQHAHQAAPDVLTSTNIVGAEDSHRHDAAILLRLAGFVQRMCRDPPEAESFSFRPLLSDMLEAAKAPDATSHIQRPSVQRSPQSTPQLS